ncbi:erythromycin esterase domain-containing protein [Trichoderma chlorosporum]
MQTVKSKGGSYSGEAAELLKSNLTVLPSVYEDGYAFAKQFDDFGSCRVLLIGDASHGTSEFYTARAEITKYMIEHHGFNIVAVEADWPDAEAIDRSVRHRPVFNSQPIAGTKMAEQEPAFRRFPTWMWRNHEVKDFAKWLRHWNSDSDAHDAVGFYGLDLYSLGASMQAVIAYLDRIDPKMADAARYRYKRLMQWAEEPHEYGLESLSVGFNSCEKDVLVMLKALLHKRLEYSSAIGNGEEFHSAEQNARLIKDAEHYYKAMYYGRDESWNLRDMHMFETLERILQHRGSNSKAIVWAHNSHIGDARSTSMGWSRHELNIGQLTKEKFGNEALSIGCGTHSGTVAAAHRWDGDMHVMQVRPSLSNSYENLMHATGVESFLVDLRKGKCMKELRAALMEPRIERFIGVIYHPDTERQSHYCSAILPKQFDCYVWFEQTHHVRALDTHQPHRAVEFEETWPFGV